jgi:hypothetical protein
MSSEETRLAESVETSAEALVGELGAVRDAVEELYILLDHIWRNRDELRDILSEVVENRSDHREQEEIVACCQCNASQVSLAEAVRAGWTSFQTSEDGDYNYLAVCPDCHKKQVEQERQRATLAAEVGLTADQVQQATAEGVATAPGVRPIGKNAHADEIPETIACARCDVNSPESLADALQEGWTNLCRDDGSGWNYLGICPECLAQEIAENQEKPDEQKRLFG